MLLQISPVSPLEKIFADQPLKAERFNHASCLKGETVSFQIACFCDAYANLFCSCDHPAAVMREAALVACETPARDNSDDPAVERTIPGLYPDPLLPIDGYIRLAPNQWRSVFVTLNIPDNERCGKKEINFTFTAVNNRNPDITSKAETTFTLEVIDAVSPEQKLVNTQWFHADCIYTYYNVQCWSEEHWTLLEKYFRNMTSHGINMLLTPVWTPPLDTAKGGERPTVQLVDAAYCNGTFSFDFARLERWIDLARNCGIKYFEFAHPFTQWGAEHAPKIMVCNNGVYEKMFGWDTSSSDELYVAFLRGFFAVLIPFLEKKGIKDQCYFHVSDEPNVSHIPVYSKCAELMRELVCGCKIIDALSNIEFYRLGLVALPVPGNDHIEDFYADKVEPLWTYYCCGQCTKVPNRFINFPSYRNRVMGVLLYVYNISGFLHWGYNFWFSRLSVRTDIDPFRVTDADRSFPSGDAFLVYPGKHGPVDSIRHEILREAIQDQRALQKLESLIGKDKTLELIHYGLDYKLSMEHYPHSAEWLLDLRERVNMAIKNAVCI
ncbi:MAG: DUF4091 domain-containing protein [Lentisphaeria bacterium]|nr:DUF4091 domain-containing protein [Lentisphaeria bacterium]